MLPQLGCKLSNYLMATSGVLVVPMSGRLKKSVFCIKYPSTFCKLGQLMGLQMPNTLLWEVPQSCACGVGSDQEDEKVVNKYLNHGW